MLDHILDQLKSEAMPALMNKVGLNDAQAAGSIQAAGASVQQALTGNDGFGMDDVLNLFSSAKNSAGADGILHSITNTFKDKLSADVGLNAQQVGGVSDLIIPMITKLLSDKVGGEAGNLQGLLNGFGGGDLGGLAKGMLGKLFG
jgi:hypothetical protein